MDELVELADGENKTKTIQTGDEIKLTDKEGNVFFYEVENKSNQCC